MLAREQVEHVGLELAQHPWLARQFVVLHRGYYLRDELSLALLDGLIPMAVFEVRWRVWLRVHTLCERVYSELGQSCLESSALQLATVLVS